MAKTLCPAPSFIDTPVQLTQQPSIKVTNALLIRLGPELPRQPPLTSPPPSEVFTRGRPGDNGNSSSSSRLFVSYAYIMQLTHEYIQRERTISWEPHASFVLNIKETRKKVESRRGRGGCFVLYVLIWNHPPAAPGHFQSKLWGESARQTMLIM